MEKYYLCRSDLLFLAIWAVNFCVKSTLAAAIESTIIFPSDIPSPQKVPREESMYRGNFEKVETSCSPHSIIYGTAYVDGGCPRVLKIENSFRAFVFDPKTCQCYTVYSRGPCAADQWIIPKDGRYQCDTNPCFGFHTGVNIELIPFRGICAELNKPHAMCGKFEEVKLSTDGITATCTLTTGEKEDNSLIVRNLAGVVGHKTLKCPAGHKLSGDNNCYPVVTFQDLERDLQAPSQIVFW